MWDIKDVKKQLGPGLCKNILFLHAVLGCDTTSQLYGIGKGTSLKKFKTSQHFQEQATMFDTESDSPEEIFAAGEQALVALYNGKLGENWIRCAISVFFFRKLLQALLLFLHKPCPLLLLLQNTTASEFISKYWSEKDVLTRRSVEHWTRALTALG